MNRFIDDEAPREDDLPGVLRGVQDDRRKTRARHVRNARRRTGHDDGSGPPPNDPRSNNDRHTNRHHRHNLPAVPGNSQRLEHQAAARHKTKATSPPQRQSPRERILEHSYLIHLSSMNGFNLQGDCIYNYGPAHVAGRNCQPSAQKTVIASQRRRAKVSSAIRRACLQITDRCPAT